MTEPLDDGMRLADERLTLALREWFAPPSDVEYWNGLESRILDRIRGEVKDWSAPFAGWVRGGLVAAGIATLAVVAALGRERADEIGVAYESFVETPQPAVSQAMFAGDEIARREATLRFVIAP